MAISWLVQSSSFVISRGLFSLGRGFDLWPILSDFSVDWRGYSLCALRRGRRGMELLIAQIAGDPGPRSFVLAGSRFFPRAISNPSNGIPPLTCSNRWRRYDCDQHQSPRWWFPAVQAHHRRWPWITTLAILIAFCLRCTIPTPAGNAKDDQSRCEHTLQR